MNADLELNQLTLTGAISLLTYLQYAQFQQQALEAGAIAATLCNMLSQLNQQYPGLAAGYGWQEISTPALHSPAMDQPARTIAHSQAA
ncbi:hypothetical protein [Thermoleptolyngbya sp. C42_A2020_037]|uniref:hypothetical protein n=1 Tax=Thermoleptolyngbya sp. C42_A2020_037 TaxID=2747799 RepID=UPI0019EEFDB4|nr:hypothetical protein [Thermoleptolyngbya sp. C42_A2020_037]MBF2085391.1 hypothetical protein [Thermoleptolyngbya sp. C42_A2020_037]